MLKFLCRSRQTDLRFLHACFGCVILAHVRLNLTAEVFIADVPISVVEEPETLLINACFELGLRPVFDSALDLAGDRKTEEASVGPVHDLCEVDHVADSFHAKLKLLALHHKLLRTLCEILRINESFLDHVVYLMTKETVLIGDLRRLIEINVVDCEHCQLFDASELQLEAEIQVSNGCIKSQHDCH